MNDVNMVATYVQSCTGGKLALSDCGPVWQLGIIAVLLLSAITALIVLRIRSLAAQSPVSAE